MLLRVLIASDSPSQQARLERLLASDQVVLSGLDLDQDLTESLTGTDFDLLLADRARLPEHPDGFIHSIRMLPEQPEIVVLTQTDDSSERGRLLAAGCMAVLSSKLADDLLSEAVGTLIGRCQEETANRLREERREDPPNLSDFHSASPGMQLFLHQVRRVIHADTSLLILGETGVGKERLARAICGEGPRSSGPFLAVNCAALPESLLESELFGHEEGAFTGATRARRGYFELAHGGSILLDEIGELPLHLQVKLLRVLDQRRIQRVGGERPIPVDVRVLAATNRDLEAEVAEKRFRSDLFYRLAVVTLEVPPLRERAEDIPQLVNTYLEQFRIQTGRTATSVDAAAMRALENYNWPGNVRELINTMERAVLLCSGDQITIKDLSSRLSAAATGLAKGPAESVSQAVSLLPEQLWDEELPRAKNQLVSQFERSYLIKLLQATRGRIGEAARRSGVHERSLYTMMKRHGLKKEKFKWRSP
jgi:DNA-binding NtrC family response regulator